MLCKWSIGLCGRLFFSFADVKISQRIKQFLREKFFCGGYTKRFCNLFWQFDCSLVVGHRIDDIHETNSNFDVQFVWQNNLLRCSCHAI